MQLYGTRPQQLLAPRLLSSSSLHPQPQDEFSGLALGFGLWSLGGQTPCAVGVIQEMSRFLPFITLPRLKSTGTPFKTSGSSSNNPSLTVVSDILVPRNGYGWHNNEADDIARVARECNSRDPYVTPKRGHICTYRESSRSTVQSTGTGIVLRTVDRVPVQRARMFSVQSQTSGLLHSFEIEVRSTEQDDRESPGESGHANLQANPKALYYIYQSTLISQGVSSARPWVKDIHPTGKRSIPRAAGASEISERIIATKLHTYRHAKGRLPITSALLTAHCSRSALPPPAHPNKREPSHHPSTTNNYQLIRTSSITHLALATVRLSLINTE
ncbi:hypothetical protein MBM_05079 [Drepanopeziza brunnea f. sp. 'multigermtubi' MB_m1]|uniref:Uncharacterized protein n=1 Tax=Marssonina brunnea f. sp. multigermtubi (strain MB_m1) TaxID=1072389 RepID=K1WGE9_MARBU|nr:uncharacterized protein MBM_05079 [Drepanopeziza brunnea f. sp. 'multigermtubi' MB_m1]EKD16610.1 hypothetical protein MBM_05079 [Drepanopeziza brunnea f. sp. 'multigermtubi' MB_m1]